MVTTEKILLYLSLIFFFVTNSFVSVVRAGSALFVFGDSYVDTGNEALAIPYGITFPGKPAGRFSDGRVFTDYGIIPFITRVVNQVATNMKRIRSLGVKKVAASSLPPLGCLPNDKLNFTNKDCNEQENMLVNLHNLQLQEAVAKLNNGSKDEPYVILDLYQAFITVIKNKGDHPGSSKFKDPLKPCCVGVSSGYNCASVDENGAKKYTVCDDPGSSLYWDIVHPTQAGWKSVYLALRSSLQQLEEKKTD